MDSKKRGRPRKRRCDSSDCPIPLAVRRLDVGQRNETLFSERTHPHRDSSHNSSQNYINRSINLRIVNNNNINNNNINNNNISNNNINNSLSSTHSLSTANSLFTEQSLSIDFNELNWFNFERVFGWSDTNVAVKLRAIGLLYPPDDPELYNCPKCNGDLRRSEDQKRILGYRYRCKVKNCSGTFNPAENTWFSGLHKSNEQNPILRSLKLCFCLLCGIGVGLAAEQTKSDPKFARKIYRKVRNISSHHLKSTTWTIGGPGLTVECDESHIFKRKYNRGRVYVLEDWWIFGAICRETGECFAMVVPDRTKNTLWPLMASRIAAGSTVFTDSAAVYDGITGLGMDWVHLKVNHRKTFVRHVLYRGHVYIVHTNRIERLWRHIKSFIRSPQSPNYLNEQVDWSIYHRIFLKDKPKGLAFKKFLEDTTQFLSGPSQVSYDAESLSEPLEFTESDEQFDDFVNLGDSDSDSESDLD